MGCYILSLYSQLPRNGSAVKRLIAALSPQIWKFALFGQCISRPANFVTFIFGYFFVSFSTPTHKVFDFQIEPNESSNGQHRLSAPYLLIAWYMILKWSQYIVEDNMNVDNTLEGST